MFLLMRDMTSEHTPENEAHVELHTWKKNPTKELDKLLCYWQDQVCSSHCYKHTQTPTERLVLNPLKSYEWRSNGKVNRPRRKINLENCLNSCRPVSLSLRDHTEGRGWDECLLVLRGQVHSLYNGLRGLINFVSVPPTSIGSFLCLLKALTNSKWEDECE